MIKFSFLGLFFLFSLQAFASGSATIDHVIQDYFQGYQQANIDLIQNSFHPETRLLSVDKGKMDVTEMKDWLKNLEERHSRGDVRQGILKIESIDISFDTAFVKLKITFKTFEFIDYLSLLRIEGKWIIVGKIYHYQEI